MERVDHGGGMNIGDVVLHPAESLDVLVQGLPFLLGNDMQITGLAMSLVASCEGANELMAQIRPRSPTKKKWNPPASASTKT